VLPVLHIYFLKMDWIDIEAKHTLGRHMRCVCGLASLRIYLKDLHAQWNLTDA
jgi:hypothetical protein